ncbi:response regulator [Magnetovibrio sp.]|uniref:response regulator n=1 Tax=Magnetovibrio sp. TaxID=2024836 RepID=UPI002F93D4E5
MKIVLVDDDPDLIEVMYLSLQQAGHEVLASPAGGPIVSNLKYDPPDVLITDLVMAELTGLELCELVKANARLSGMKIILISARTDKLWKEKARACGADGFIDKPIDPVTFAADVEQIVAQAI